MAKKDHDEPLERPGQWLLLAQKEVARRLDTAGAEHDAQMDRELQVRARVKATYPDIPEELAEEFNQRLQAGQFTPEAWESAAAWLEATAWFVDARRHEHPPT